jgi:putative transposase
MRKKRFSVEQMIGVFEAGGSPCFRCRGDPQGGISEQTFCRWKAKYAGLEVDQVRQMAELQEENLRLKQLVAELTLDKTMLQDVLSKNGEAFAAWIDGGASRRKSTGERSACLPRAVPTKSDQSLSKLPC